nr:RNA-directed DNA polymerase, eukaryota [Tanacetum cinerariifolium]
MVREIVFGVWKRKEKGDGVDMCCKRLKSFGGIVGEGFTPKDLWKVCNDYGIVVDVFIPNKKSKVGKHFAFVRFIKVINLDCLIENLNTIWIGRFHLFANFVRFERPKKLVFLTYKDMHAAPSNSMGFRQPKAQDYVGSYVNVVNGSSFVDVPGPYISSTSALVLDDSCVVERDLSKYAMGKVKDVNSIPNLRTLLMDEGFSDVKLMYLRGIPLNVWSRETFMRIGKKWGEMLDIEDNVDSSFGRRRLCIKTKQPLSILESFKIIFKGLGHKTKKEWIKELSLKNNINFMAIQETKTNCISHMDVKFMWGNSNYNYVYSEAVWNLGRWNGETIILGDFNEVRSIDERRGSCFNPSSARVFDHFISTSGLVDVKLEGYAFTCSEGFDAMVEQTWHSFSHSDVNRMILFKKKLQDLKAIIRCWVKDKRMHRSGEKNSIKNELNDIDKEVDRGVVSDTNIFRRLELQRHRGGRELKILPCIINKKRSQLAIREVFDNALWCTDSCKARFKKPVAHRFMLDFPFNKRLSDMQAADLERHVSRDEIRLAVWNCGENKSPVDKGLFKGVHLQGSISISHLFYADDAMFIGEWSDANLKGVVNILQCFFLASGLKIIIHKSQVLGVGIPRSIVMQAASSIGCGVMHNQFRYLGVMVGECMSRHQAWDDTVLKLRSRLSNWKVKTLSIGGRLTLLKSVLGASPLYNMSIFKVPKGILKSMEAIRSNFFNEIDSTVKKITWAAWDKILASKENGGLGVLSFHALNRAFLLKWVWRFISQDGSLWFRVIQALYGPSIVSHPMRLSPDHYSPDMSMVGVGLVGSYVLFGLAELVFFYSSSV